MKKKIFINLLWLFLFGTTSFAVANTENKSLIEVFYTIGSIKIDNKYQQFTESPFIYNGTTYVPLREISKAMGRDITWDEQTRSIDIQDECTNRQGDFSKIRQFCILEQQVKLPEDAVVDAIVITAEGEIMKHLPIINIARNKSKISISLKTGVVTRMDESPNEVEPFDFLQPYITGYLTSEKTIDPT